MDFTQTQLLREWTSLPVLAFLILRKPLRRNIRSVTMPIINVGFCFRQEKLIQKKKIWLGAVAQWESLPSSPH